MTRLTSEWIGQMEETAAAWNEELCEMTGLDFSALAALASGMEKERIEIASRKYRAAIVPITSGLGIIQSFAESVAAIVRVMGFDAFVTSTTDVDGIYEAHMAGADILYMADDDRYIAVNMRNGKIGDNNKATAEAFAELLIGMAGGLADRNVAVLGYGIIGKLMAAYLAEKGAAISVYDKNADKEAEVTADGFKWLSDAAELKKYQYIADGTSEGGWITEDLLREDAFIAAPGIPLSLDENARRKHKGRYVHDLLETGTAYMMGLVL